MSFMSCIGLNGIGKEASTMPNDKRPFT